MKVNGTDYRSIWYNRDVGRVQIIDQRWLPYDFRIADLITLDEFAVAIREMWVRGAPLIGATAAWGIAEEMARDPSVAALSHAADVLADTRPTAINLRWALDRAAVSGTGDRRRACGEGLLRADSPARRGRGPERTTTPAPTRATR